MPWVVKRKLRAPGVSSYAGTNPRMVWKGTRRAPAKVPRLPKKYRSAITRVIKAQEETKYVAEVVQDHKNHNCSIFASGDSFAMLPQIKQGTDDFQRIGRVVAPTKGYVDVHLSFTPNGMEGIPVQSAQQIYAVVYHVTNRAWKNYPSIPVGPGVFGGLLDNGDGTSSYFSGDIRDLQKPINTDQFRLIKKYIVKLTRNTGFTQGDLVAGNSPNMPSLSGYIRVPLKRMPKLRYDPGIGQPGAYDYPTNYAPLLAVGFAYADGTQVQGGLGEQTLLQVTATAHLWYKDA